MNFGYIRVSAKDQNEARQVAALETLDIPHGNLYMDKQSGKDFTMNFCKKRELNSYEFPS